MDTSIDHTPIKTPIVKTPKSKTKTPKSALKRKTPASKHETPDTKRKKLNVCRKVHFDCDDKKEIKIVENPLYKEVKSNTV